LDVKVLAALTFLAFKNQLAVAAMAVGIAGEYITILFGERIIKEMQLNDVGNYAFTPQVKKVLYVLKMW